MSEPRNTRAYEQILVAARVDSCNKSPCVPRSKLAINSLGLQSSLKNERKAICAGFVDASAAAKLLWALAISRQGTPVVAGAFSESGSQRAAPRTDEPYNEAIQSSTLVGATCAVAANASRSLVTRTMAGGGLAFARSGATSQSLRRGRTRTGIGPVFQSTGSTMTAITNRRTAGGPPPLNRPGIAAIGFATAVKRVVSP